VFEAQVRRAPQAEAVVGEGQRWSYDELNRRANQLARRLQAAGVEVGTPVAVALERSVEFVVGVLAVLKAGGVYVPLAAEYPPARRRYVVEDSSARVLLGPGAVPAEFAGLELVAVPVAAARETKALSGNESANLEWRGTGTEAAYVMYTSGSTGRPKGVAVPHRAVVRLVRGQEYVAFGPEQRVLLLAPTAFDASTFELWGGLLNGGTCVVAPPGLPELEVLEALIRAERVTCVWLTAGLFNQVVDQRPSLLAGVPQVVTGGEVLSVGHVQRALERWPGVRLVNGYGPTEGTTFTCAHRIEPGTVAAAGTVPIGRPLANTRCYVVDEEGELAPVGAVGELWIGGDGVALGYVKDAELTAARFVPDRWGGGSEGRLYRTGDYVRCRGDGVLEFVGRKDGQVKVRGYRVEVGEVEGQLGQHPGVQACAVGVVEGVGGVKVLVGYVVWAGGEEGGRGRRQDACTTTVRGNGQDACTTRALRDWLKERVPEYLVPSQFVCLEALPLTANGKVDRAALAQLGRVGTEFSRGYVGPRDEREERLARIWAEVLGVERVGIHDSFLELGGHSLLALSLAARLSRHLGVEVPLRWVLERGTVAALVERIRTGGTTGPAEEPVRPADRSQPLPASFGQQRLWWLQQTLPEPATYNVPAVFRLHGVVDVDRLRGALQALQRRHEVLRTALVSRGDGLEQVVTNPAQVPAIWRTLDLLDVPRERQPARVEQALKAEIGRPFDLSQAPLWRALWITLAEDVGVLALTFHHSVIDEWSLRVLFKELEALYAAGGEGAEAGLDPLAVQYADYAVWERQRLAGDYLVRHVSYWQAQLADLPATGNLPSTRRQPTRRDGRGAVHRFQLSGEVPRRVRDLAQREGTSLFTTALATFLVWLERCSAQEDVVVGTPIAHRPRLELESMVGFCLNTLPVRVRLPGSLSFRAALARVRESVMGALDHVALPFERIVELAPRGPGRSASPLHEVMFVLLEQGRWDWRLGSARPEPVAVDTGTSKQDLMLSLQIEGDEWQGEFEYATDRFSAAEAERMAVQWQALLGAIVADPDQPIARLDLGSAEESVGAAPVPAPGDVPPKPRLGPSAEARGTRRPALALGSAAEGDEPVLAATPLERRLTAIWEELLRRRGIGVTDGFYEIGGHSLLAIRLLSQVQRETGVTVPLRQFFEAPTIRALAGALEKETQGSSVGGSRPAVGGAAGPVVTLLGWYLDLETLGLDPRAHQVIPFPEFETTPEQCRVEFLAERCLEALRAKQPQGPYVLAGYSLAGLVAYEMAHRLTAAGEQVPLVAVFDTRPAGWVRRLGLGGIRFLAARLRLSFRTQLVLGRFWLYLLQFVRGGLYAGTRGSAPDVRAGLGRAWQFWRRHREEAGEELGGPGGAESAATSEPRRPVGVFLVHWWIHSSYRPEPYDGKLALFTSEQLARERPFRGRGWGLWVSSFSEHVVPGNHLGCIARHSQVLAEKLRECLAEVAQEPPR
jgi:amino acid adenylation domain-containing protein